MVRSTFGLSAMTALEPVFSNRPPTIQFLNTSISLSESLPLGGMVGSSAWVMT